MKDEFEWKKFNKISREFQLFDIKKENDGMQMAITKLTFLPVSGKKVDTYLNYPGFWIEIGYLTDNILEHIKERLGYNKFGLKQGDKIRITIERVEQ